MQIVTNEKLISGRARLGRWASLLGLGVLLAGLVISFKWPHLVWVTFGCLILGFLLSQIGIYNASRWIREPRADQVLNQALKGLDNRYRLFHYLTPVPHLLIGPPGLFVFVAKPQEGIIRYDGRRWRRAWSWLRFFNFLGEEGIGNPPKEAEIQVEQLRKWLRKQLPEETLPPITGVVVFIHDAQLELEETPPVPVLPHKKLKQWLRQQAKQRTALKPAQIEQLTALWEK